MKCNELCNKSHFSAYTGLARINLAVLDAEAKSPEYSALSHAVIFVQPLGCSNQTYLVDVGCAGFCLTQPILLSESPENIVIGSSPTERHRLRKGEHPGSSLGQFNATLVILLCKLTLVFI